MMAYPITTLFERRLFIFCTIVVPKLVGNRHVDNWPRRIIPENVYLKDTAKNANKAKMMLGVYFSLLEKCCG